jgi:hypothetical protein
MGLLSEGITATDPALRLLKKRGIDLTRFVWHLDNMRRLLHLSRIEIVKSGESFAVYIHMEG